MPFANLIKIMVGLVLVAAVSFFFTLRVLPSAQKERKEVLLELRPFSEMVQELEQCIRYNNGEKTTLKVSCKEILRQIRLRTQFHKPEFFEDFKESNFEVYRVVEDYMLYIKRSCTESDINFKAVTLNYYPLDKDRLPKERQKFGFISQDFNFKKNGIRQDAFCVALKKLPYGRPSKILTGLYGDEGKFLWSVSF